MHLERVDRIDSDDIMAGLDLDGTAAGGQGHGKNLSWPHTVP